MGENNIQPAAKGAQDSIQVCERWAPTSDKFEHFRLMVLACTQVHPKQSGEHSYSSMP